MKRVIGLLGRAGSGKSTAAKYINEKYGARRLSFAKPLKELAKRLWLFTDEQVYGTQEQKETIDPRYGFSPREALIRLGDEARNVIGLDVWINACFNEMRRAEGALFIIEDVRYPNEAQHIFESEEFDGHVIKLDYADRKSSVDPNAPSERGVDEVEQGHIFATVHHWNDDCSSLKAGLDEVVEPLLEGP